MSIMNVLLMIIFIFTFIPLVLAEFARARSIPTLEDFFLQGRKMPLLMSFFTVYATWVSSFAFLGAPSSFYSQGPLYMTCFAWNVLFGLLFMVIGRRIWRIGKAAKLITPTDFFNEIYGSKTLNFLVVVIMTVFTIPYLMIQLYGGACIIETASGGLIPWRAAGLVFYLVIIIYLWAGGLRAVALTDIFYGTFTFIAMLVCGLIMIERTGGINSTFQIITKNGDGNVILQDGISAGSPVMWLCMFIIIPIGALMGPPIWIRMYAIKNEKQFKIMPLLLAAVTIMYVGPMLAGSAARVLYPDMDLSDNLIPYMLLDHVPLIASTVLLCGIATAALSTANSQIHALAAIYTIDVHKHFIKPDASEYMLVSVGKWAVLGLSACAYVLMLERPGMIIETGTIGMGGTAQIIVPTIGALFWSKSKPKAASAGLIAGCGLFCVLAFFVEIEIVYAAAVSLAINGFLFVFLSNMMKPNMEVREKIIYHMGRFSR